MIVERKEIMKDLKFCKELMDRLVEYAEKTYRDDSYYNNRTAIQKDIIRLRRELMAVSHKLDG